MPIKKLSEYAVEISRGKGMKKITILTLNSVRTVVGGHISINMRGPRGGNEQAMIVDADDLLTALEMLGYRREQ
jgi:hypothetical protein